MIIIISFLAIVFAYYFMQKERIRREKRHERMQDKQEELLERLRARKRKEEQEDGSE